jgi:hypothetical protein
VEVDRSREAAPNDPAVLDATARSLVERLGLRRVVGLAVGADATFVQAFADMGVEVVQVDGAHQEPIADEVSDSRRLRANLEDAGDLERLLAVLSKGPPTLFMLAWGLERLADPRALLRVLRRVLRGHPANRLLIATGDRQYQAGQNEEGLPADPRCVRLWTLTELGEALRAGGFTVHKLEWAPPATGVGPRHILAEVGCTAAEYRAFFERHGWPQPVDHLIVTAEHADTMATGGIGAYMTWIAATVGQPLLVFTGGLGLPEDWQGFMRAKRWIHSAMCAGRGHASRQAIAEGDAAEVLSAVRHMVFLYDELALIQYQDFKGIGVHVAQAKRAGLLPPSLTTLATANGNSFYLDHALGDFSRQRDLRIDLRERLATELSDVVLFPSLFLRDLYADVQGLQLRRHVYQPHPVAIAAEGPDDETVGRLSTLVFHGKASVQKGYFAFCEAVTALLTHPEYAAVGRQITRVMLIGVAADTPLPSWPNVEVVAGRYPRDEARSLLRRLSSDGLVVLPYMGDNHPNTVWEVVDAHCQLLAFEAGGIPEQLPPSLHGQLLCAPHEAALAAAMATAIAWPLEERRALLRQTREAVHQSRCEARNRYRATIAGLKAPPATVQAPPAARGCVTVVVPEVDGRVDDLTPLMAGLVHSHWRPAEVVMLAASATAAQPAWDEDTLALPAHFVAPTASGSDLGAVGLDLAALTTPYVCLHDKHHVAGHRFLDLACRVLDDNPEVAAVTSWMAPLAGPENSGEQAGAESAAEYRPIGPDLGLGLSENCFGDGVVVYRLEALRALGQHAIGSGELGAAWALHLRMTAAGQAIWVLPQPLNFFPGGRLPSGPFHARFHGWMQLGRSLSGVPANQVQGLVRAVNWRLEGPAAAPLRPAAELGRDAAKLTARLHAIETSTIWRATSALRRLLARQPRVVTALRRVLGAFPGGGRRPNAPSGTADRCENTPQ